MQRSEPEHFNEKYAYPAGQYYRGGYMETCVIFLGNIMGGYSFYDIIIAKKNLSSFVGLQWPRIFYGI